MSAQHSCSWFSNVLKETARTKTIHGGSQNKTKTKTKGGRGGGQSMQERGLAQWFRVESRKGRRENCRAFSIHAHGSVTLSKRQQEQKQFTEVDKTKIKFLGGIGGEGSQCKSGDWRSGLSSSAGRGGGIIFFRSGSVLCAGSYFAIRSTPVLPE